MFTTGSKLLIGSAVVAVLVAIVYGVTQDDAQGTVGLVSAAAVLVFLAGINARLRDSNVFVDDEAPVESTAAAQFPVGGSLWPLLMVVGVVTIGVGLVSFQPIVIIGFVAVLAAGAEWAIQAWAESASVDRAHNATLRSRLSNPVEFPVGGAIMAGIVIYAFSRIMLWLSKTNTVIAFAAFAAVVLTFAFVLANRRSLKSGAIGGLIAAAAVTVVAGGAAAGLDGERDIREFETTSIYQEEAIEHPEEIAEGLICESPEEFPEADENASQTVAAKSGTTSIVLTPDGELAFDVPGPIEEGAQGLVLPRSNPNNIIFRNQSETARRLSLDLGVEEHADEDGEVELVPLQHCTTLVEEDGEQLLTLVFSVPSIAFEGIENRNGPGGPEGDGYWFFVPGVETAKLRLIVP